MEARLAAAVGGHESAGDLGRVELALLFGVSPQRNWVTLWKPAIGALGGILGQGARLWHQPDPAQVGVERAADAARAGRLYRGAE